MTHWTAFTFAAAWTLATLILALALFGLLCLLDLIRPEHRHHDDEESESIAAMIARSDQRLAEAERLSDPENTARLSQR